MCARHSPHACTSEPIPIASCRHPWQAWLPPCQHSHGQQQRAPRIRPLQGGSCLPVRQASPRVSGSRALGAAGAVQELLRGGGPGCNRCEGCFRLVVLRADTVVWGGRVSGLSCSCVFKQVLNSTSCVAVGRALMVSACSWCRWRS